MEIFNLKLELFSNILKNPTNRENVFASSIEQNVTDGLAVTKSAAKELDAAIELGGYCAALINWTR